MKGCGKKIEFIARDWKESYIDEYICGEQQICPECEAKSK